MKQCKIVTLDWLEDSLFRDKKLPVKDYSLNAVLKNERAKESQVAKLAKGNELAERFVNTSRFTSCLLVLRLQRHLHISQDLYHVYADASNFFYEITLTRDDTEAGWQGQKYILYVCASLLDNHFGLNTNTPADLRIQRQAAPVPVRSQILPEAPGLSTQVPPPERDSPGVLDRVREVQVLLPEEDGHRVERPARPDQPGRVSVPVQGTREFLTSTCPTAEESARTS